MQIDRAAHIIIIFWALIVLSEKHQEAMKDGKNTKSRVGIHSVKSILDTINHPKLKSDTISKCLDYLESNGAIECKYEKGKRKGKRIEYFNLKPEQIPKSVYQAKVSNASASRWKKAFAELGIAHQKKGKTFLDAKAMIEQGGEEFVKALKTSLTLLDQSESKRQPIDDAETWFIENLNGQKVEIDPNTLEFFIFGYVGK